jgi:uncharacterized membrane protein
MNAAEFLRRLERGLRDFPAAERTMILADYQRYFADGAAAGRAEAEVAESLGSPARLAAELLLGRDVQAWRAPGGARSPFRTLRTMSALVLLEGLVWLPALLAILLLLAMLGAGLAALMYGVFTLAVEPFDDPLGGVGAALLRAVGWLSAGTALLLAANTALHGIAILIGRRARASSQLLSSQLSREVPP